jgi:hypothetical protein
LIDISLEGGQLGCEVGFQGVNAGIGVIHLRCEMFDGDMGLIDESLEILVASGGHLEKGSAGKEKKMGGWDHKKKGIRSDRYHDDQCLKGNIMG